MNDLRNQLSATGITSEQVEYLLTIGYASLHALNSIQFNQRVTSSLASYDNDMANPGLAKHLPRIAAGRVLLEWVYHERVELARQAAIKAQEHKDRIEEMNREYK